MAKLQTRYVCQSCGASYSKWTGRCDACEEWNSVVEEAPRDSVPGGLKRSSGNRARRVQFQPLQGSSEPLPRRTSGIAEFDRVCGGGLVPGSAVLIGGDPGIGKSTLLLQVVAALARSGTSAAYVSGEEAIDQIRLRASRLGLADSPVDLASATSVGDIADSLDSADAPVIVVIDSIQTMFVENLDSAPGTVSQVRASAQALIRLAKERGFTLLLVGHVTKEGVIAGPKVLEHMVDAVLTFEGERGHQFRILRATKNRFGATDEIGVFEMTDRGLEEVANPSALFLADRQHAVSGAAVFAGMEGTRPLLVELQALVSNSPLGTPRRAVVGWDGNRLSMVLAVLETRCGLSFAGKDVYLNVAGGLKVNEPAADLAVAAALVSALSDRPVPMDCVVFGEIGLSGEIRVVGQSEARLKEAEKLGFASAILPDQRQRRGGRNVAPGLQRKPCEHLRDLVAIVAGGPRNLADSDSEL
ncbi:DNA repair protein RadA [Limibacillus halophilus]|uniref:DNA repair protein RadA n=1 Tax=Limibacillus halophilus TaxID=1579333 RepID=A0A839SS65_9PROT|nr:DNA repair protein RadA [Limibacillus halophilus]MBB3064624.1 DNA repair protein RadA/Sms [Limibacillus halophilus]